MKTLPFILLSGLALFGCQATQNYSQETVKISNDPFTKTATILGQSARGKLDKTMLRAWVKDNKIEGIQIYSELITSEWTYPQSAIDLTGKVYSIQKIGNDVSCSGSSCVLYDFVGIMVDYDFLKNNLAGFELSYRGKYRVDVNVKGEQVNQMLTALAQYQQ